MTATPEPCLRFLRDVFCIVEKGKFMLENVTVLPMFVQFSRRRIAQAVEHFESCERCKAEASQPFFRAFYEVLLTKNWSEMKIKMKEVFRILGDEEFSPL